MDWEIQQLNKSDQSLNKNFQSFVPSTGERNIHVNILLMTLFLFGFYGLALCQMPVSSPSIQNKLDEQWNDLLNVSGALSSLAGDGTPLLKACLNLNDDQILAINKFKDLLWQARQDGKYLDRVEIEQTGDIVSLEEIKKMEPGPIKSAYEKWHRDYSKAYRQMEQMRKVLGNKSSDFLQWVFEEEGIKNKIQFPKNGEKLDAEKIAKDIVAGSEKQFGAEKKSGYNWNAHEKKLRLRAEYFMPESRPASAKLSDFEKDEKNRKENIFRELKQSPSE
jgi:hypothetical protein